MIVREWTYHFRHHWTILETIQTSNVKNLYIKLSFELQDKLRSLSNKSCKVHHWSRFHVTHRCETYICRKRVKWKRGSYHIREPISNKLLIPNPISHILLILFSLSMSDISLISSSLSDKHHPKIAHHNRFKRYAIKVQWGMVEWDLLENRRDDWVFQSITKTSIDCSLQNAIIKIHICVKERKIDLSRV